MNVRPDHATIAPEEFFRWINGQEAKYELVEGEVVMMAGAGRRQDAIVVNLTSSIHSQTRAIWQRPTEPGSAGTAQITMHDAVADADGAGNHPFR